MEIFEKIGEMASQTYKYTAGKADRIARETKLKMKINENKAKIENLYNEIGETVYRKYLNVSNEEFDEEIKRDCEEIDKISKEIEEQNQELLSLKDRKQCPNCHEKIDIEAKYCSNCGLEQEMEYSEENKEETSNDPIEVSATEEEKASNDENS